MQEKYYNRDLSYSIWHRHPNLPKDISWIDIDACEYCDICKEPLALIELAIDVGQEEKPFTVTKKLAEKANIEAYLVLYKLDFDNPIKKYSKNAQGNKVKIIHYPVISFRVKQIFPKHTKFYHLSLDRYQKFLTDMRYKHRCRSVYEQQDRPFAKTLPG